ncbi:GLT8D1 [Symbiodinium necroappetens]|uniref:GLT8D1 protein n=1 Tax=Symbiodinium necroappetens TaxID=1628268 RepID=A0A812TSI6_9DINO|nr:GLT8D1 [Symbiodinium necroappetens]
MVVEEPEPVPTYTPPTAKSPGIPAKAYPGHTVWQPPQSGSPVMSTSSRPISYSPGDFVAEPAPEPGQEEPTGLGATASSHLSPDPVPKKARGPVGETSYVEKIPQWLVQSWGRVGVVYIRRVAQDILHGAQQHGYMDSIQEANRTNPLLMDLQSAYPEPQDPAPPMSASTGTYRPNFNFRDFLQRPSLGEHFHPGEGPPRPGRSPLPCIYDQPTHDMPLAASMAEADHAANCMGMWARRLLGQEEDSDVELTAEERAEVARIEEECSDLERRMRNLSTTQQRSLLENLANASSAVIGGLLADTVRRTAQMRGKGAKGSGRQKVKANQASANKDPKYLEDLSKGLSHTEAFIRHRSRLRAIQHQMEYGDVSLQPRATQLQTDRPLPPMLSLGRSHRLGLLDRLHRLEQRGVTWTQEDVDRCLTMERFLDYLENREAHQPDAPSETPGTASKSAGAPPPRDPTSRGPEDEQSTSTRPNPGSSDPRTTTTNQDETLGNPSWTAQASGEPPSEISPEKPPYWAELYITINYNRCRAAS